jgi:hypothetical protein
VAARRPFSTGLSELFDPSSSVSKRRSRGPVMAAKKAAEGEPSLARVIGGSGWGFWLGESATVCSVLQWDVSFLRWIARELHPVLGTRDTSSSRIRRMNLSLGWSADEGFE